MTRISSGKIALQRTRMDMCEIVRKATEDLRLLFARANLEFDVHIVAGPAWVDADPTRVTQVVGNLLQNAAKFTPSGGSVAVRLAIDGEAAELRVRDSGVGMAPDTIDRMFEPFAQAEQTLARTKGGLGLGLALVKGLVELHGGSVEARSDGIGLGTEFVVRLPLAARSTASPHKDAAGTARRGRRVLVIEDNADAAQALADLLEMHGHVVRTARDGTSGVALARDIQPDVVLCDVGLPDVDGYAVARALRADGALSATRLVALSGYGQPEDRQRAREAGFDAHIAKPADVDKLLEVVGGEWPRD